MLYTNEKPLLSTIYTLNEIENILPIINSYSTCGPCTLVAFDIDETLIWAANPTARSEWFNKQLKSYKEQGLSTEEAIKKFLVQHLQAHNNSVFFPVDIDTNKLFELIKQKNIHILGLTAREPLMDTMTIQQFAKAKINFPHPIPRWNRTFVFQGPNYPVLAVDGIIYSTGQNKGRTLELFLDRLSYQPNLLIMVDDMLYNIQNVQKTAEMRKIPFIGIHLTKYKNEILPLLQQGVQPSAVAKIQSLQP